jgi:hypothetical protein
MLDLVCLSRWTTKHLRIELVSIIFSALFLGCVLESYRLYCKGSMFGTLRYTIHNDRKVPRKIPSSFREALFSALGNFTSIAERFSLEYYVCGGTLLGAVWHGTLIPWDDDAYICVPRETINRLHNDSVVKSNLEKLGCWMDYADFIYRFRCNPSTYIFEMEILQQSGFIRTRTVVRYSQLRNQEKWSWEFFYASELYPLKNYSFGHLQVAGPTDPIPYLDRSFGSTLWGLMPGFIPTGMSGAQFGQSWRKAHFTYQHHSFPQRRVYIR